MLRWMLDCFLDAAMAPEPADSEFPPHLLSMPSDWVCFWDLGYLLAETRRRSSHLWQRVTSPVVERSSNSCFSLERVVT
jgi:hypothetical protein